MQLIHEANTYVLVNCEGCGEAFNSDDCLIFPGEEEISGAKMWTCRCGYHFNLMFWHDNILINDCICTDGRKCPQLHQLGLRREAKQETRRNNAELGELGQFLLAMIRQ